jgi:hypothetical protein
LDIEPYQFELHCKVVNCKSAGSNRTTAIYKFDRTLQLSIYPDTSLPPVNATPIRCDGNAFKN